MMWRIPLFLLLLPATASAQLQLFTYDGTTEKPVTAITDLGSVPNGDSVEVRFRLRNNGASSVALQTVSLAGQGFSITSAPSLPFIVAPANFTEVRVRFSPSGIGSYSASFAANTAQTLLRASVVPSVTISLVNNTVGSVLSSGATLDFGRVQKGQSASQQLRVANGTSAKLVVQSCAVTGSAFRASPLACPLNLAPGDAVTVTITFNPAAAGNQTGTIAFDTRSFNLVGVGFDPPLPKASVAFSTPLASGMQEQLTVQLASAAQSSGTGTVTLEFQPSAAGVTDDPAVRFTSSGARTLSFQVKEGDQTATFPAGVSTVFQTGTTAGTILFRVHTADYDDSFSFPIAAAAICVDQASANRRTGFIDVSLSGFDNTRTAGKFSFAFYDASGRAVQPGAIPVDWTQSFASYFQSSTVGGSFLMRASFPTTGDTSQVTEVEVQMTNSAGTTKTSKITF
jgi:hypothetical protein